MLVSIPPKISVSSFVGYFYRKKDFIARSIPNPWFGLHVS